MAALRILDPPPITYLPRASLPAATHPEVDAVLKRLKICTRRLHAALATHRLELQIIDRLYYKNNNQHHTALFWRKTAEMRRFGHRLVGMAVGDLTERFRLSFWGDSTLHTPKLLRGSWTHLPDVESVIFTIRRLSDCRELVKKAQERLIGAYHSFVLMMHTGAFLYLIVVLVAIASRLKYVLEEVQSTLELYQVACHKVLALLDPEQACRLKPLLKSSDAMPAPEVSVTEENMPVQPAPASAHEDAADEDIGYALHDSERTSTEATLALTTQDDVQMSFNLEEAQGASTAETTSVITRSTIVSTIRTSASQTTVPSRAQRADVSKRKGNDEPLTSKASKKKRKKKDEIDDIFGF
ncbi:uncharacterized protein LAESUDRAFT_720599 [Laetiporus sulphureus 93-53]|uniref:Nucleolus and neural progenitor protein-like N-terminal domain-containing protein n=1 Tax=Laetiporus sulphureus 93-53 TaxID=1314785 RepID=A0A165H808_9APHY|nr:uncharacterized protein LAESUDRAFT_720599 [Laetiporus sulphureus 93-53]KZT11373.1 hypothetical protein LAESUDRAFT_720599 [Laetiporus sulphureus 93-53]